MCVCVHSQLQRYATFVRSNMTPALTVWLFWRGAMTDKKLDDDNNNRKEKCRRNTSHYVYKCKTQATSPSLGSILVRTGTLSWCNKEEKQAFTSVSRIFEKRKKHLNYKCIPLERTYSVKCSIQTTQVCTVPLACFCHVIFRLSIAIGPNKQHRNNYLLN